MYYQPSTIPEFSTEQSVSYWTIQHEVIEQFRNALRRNNVDADQFHVNANIRRTLAGGHPAVEKSVTLIFRVKPTTPSTSKDALEVAQDIFDTVISAHQTNSVHADVRQIRHSYF